jgi:hypothetical protein
MAVQRSSVKEGEGGGGGSDFSGADDFPAARVECGFRGETGACFRSSIGQGRCGEKLCHVALVVTIKWGGGIVGEGMEGGGGFPALCHLEEAVKRGPAGENGRWETGTGLVPSGARDMGIAAHGKAAPLTGGQRHKGRWCGG